MTDNDLNTELAGPMLPAATTTTCIDDDESRMKEDKQNNDRVANIF